MDEQTVSVPLQFLSQWFRPVSYLIIGLDQFIGLDLLRNRTIRLIIRKYKMILTAVQSPGADLYSPIKGTMAGKVNESLLATQELEFYINGNRVLSAFGHSAGLEVAGPVEVLLDGVK